MFGTRSVSDFRFFFQIVEYLHIYNTLSWEMEPKSQQKIHVYFTCPHSLNVILYPVFSLPVLWLWHQAWNFPLKTSGSTQQVLRIWNVSDFGVWIRVIQPINIIIFIFPSRACCLVFTLILLSPDSGFCDYTWILYCYLKRNPLIFVHPHCEVGFKGGTPAPFLREPKECPPKPQCVNRISTAVRPALRSWLTCSQVLSADLSFC